MPLERIRVIIVDDSAIERQLLDAFLSSEPDFEVVGMATSALEAREKIRDLKPDVITLDVNMAGMDGIQFLRKLMRLHPTPVVMCSSLSAEGAESLQAIKLGAISFVSKPANTGQSIQEFRAAVIQAVRAAAFADAKRLEE